MSRDEAAALETTALKLQVKNEFLKSKSKAISETEQDKTFILEMKAFENTKEA